MHVEINKKEREIHFSFGTARVEKEMFHFVKNIGNELMKSVNELHRTRGKIQDKVDMKVYGFKDKIKEKID